VFYEKWPDTDETTAFCRQVVKGKKGGPIINCTTSIEEQNAVLKPLDHHILHLQWIWGTVTPIVKLWPVNEKLTMKQMVTKLSEENQKL